jgi:hypothetical protein
MYGDEHVPEQPPCELVVNAVVEVELAFPEARLVLTVVLHIREPGVVVALVPQIPTPLAVELAVDLAVVHEALLVSLPVLTLVGIQNRTRAIVEDVQFHLGDEDVRDVVRMADSPRSTLDADEVQAPSVSFNTTDVPKLPLTRVERAELDCNTGHFPASLIEGTNDSFAHPIEWIIPCFRVEKDGLCNCHHLAPSYQTVDFCKIVKCVRAKTPAQ